MNILDMYELAEELERFARHSQGVGHAESAQRARALATEVSTEARRRELRAYREEACREKE